MPRRCARWPSDGVPDRPGAWLTTVAKNRAIDRLRRERRGAELLAQEAALASPAEAMDEHEHVTGSDSESDFAFDGSGIEDDRLRLIFTCCHPALPLEGRVALTLRTLAGLTTAEIARAFLVPEPTMAKRLVRAKGKIAARPHPLPGPARASAARAAGRSAGGAVPAVQRGVRRLRRPGPHPRPALRRGDPARPRAERPHARRARGRRSARADAVSSLASRRAARRDGRRHHPRGPGPWPMGPGRDRRGRAPVCGRRCATAAPAPTSCRPPSRPATPRPPTSPTPTGPQIVSLYELLAEVMPSPVVALNHAVAVAMARGPDAGLELIDELEAVGRAGRLPPALRLRADLLRRLGRLDEAADAYRRALELAGSDAERRFLERRLAEAGQPERAS